MSADTTTELDATRAKELDRQARTATQQASRLRAQRDAELRRLYDNGAHVPTLAATMGLSPKGVYLALERARD